MSIIAKITSCCLALGIISACSGTDETNARIMCAQNLSGQGYEACVKNAGRF